ncbi:hypothetical protein [Actinoplanes regularis]|uniref:hypothetical protein n=1 Tax=Actinoplanes regularis TaxID=52697 RepID=UPI0015C583F5|nr:hypothetical protein [Actinoplanes regularis]
MPTVAVIAEAETANAKIKTADEVAEARGLLPGWTPLLPGDLSRAHRPVEPVLP